MAQNGPKNVFLSDNGSNFWPLGTKYGTIPDNEVKNIPPMWKRLLNKDVATLNAHGGYLWLLFSIDRHVAVSRIEKLVHKIKTYLKKAEVLKEFLVPHYTASEMETILASITTTLNTRPLITFKDEIVTAQTFNYHSYQMTPITDSTN